MNFIAHFHQWLFAAADYKDQRAEFRKANRHRTAKTRATAGDKNRAAFEHLFLKHRSPQMDPLVRKVTGRSEAWTTWRRDIAGRRTRLFLRWRDVARARAHARANRQSR